MKPLALHQQNIAHCFGWSLRRLDWGPELAVVEKESACTWFQEVVGAMQLSL